MNDGDPQGDGCSDKPRDINSLGREIRVMPPGPETVMDENEIDDFLSRLDTGVLSLANEDTPYAIPVSYGYDPETGQFYLRLVSNPESTKRRYLEGEPNVALVVCQARNEGSSYRSVVATGSLDQIDPVDLDPKEIERLGDTRRPLFELWDEDRTALAIELYRLDPDELTGRETAVEW